jgi:CRP-like cAMP-binding protein
MTFPELSELALAPLASLTRQQTYPSGELICREGESADKFYVIGEGEVEFTKQFTDEEERRLRTGGPGVHFGEMALVHGAVRNANVRALTGVTVLEISKDAFQEAVQTNPAMMLDIMRTLVDRLRANDASALENAPAKRLRPPMMNWPQEQLRTSHVGPRLRTPTSATKCSLSWAMAGPAMTWRCKKSGRTWTGSSVGE